MAHVVWKPVNWYKRITTRNNGNVQFNHQEQIKLNSTNNVNSGAHTLTQDNNKLSKVSKVLTKILLLGFAE